ncbi:phage portal protein, partial [Patescibacteria group bacterium]|nr:phage portal protein [Patescibacteria group bacterium]
GGAQYKGGSQTRRRRQMTGAEAREDTRATYYGNIIAACIALYRNDPMTRSIVDVVTAYMGESRPLATTSDKGFNAEATDYYNNYFWPMADARRRPGVDAGTLQQLWTRFTWIGGDMLFLLLDDGVYPYEGMQIKTPMQLLNDRNIVNGIRVQESSPHRITHYYIAGDKTDPLSRKQDFSRVRYNQAIFAPSKYWRPAMLRGVPELHAIVDSLQDFEETNDNVQSKIKFEASLFTVERKGAIANLPGRQMVAAGETGEQMEYTKADYGMRFKTTGHPDTDFKLSNMSNPGSQHVPYMEYMARIISAGVGLPYDIVLHLYESSYTASRAARCDFKRLVMDRWAWRNKVYNQRQYNWRIARAIKAGELGAAPVDKSGRSEWHKCSWTLPHFDQIDEGKEVKADVQQWRAGGLVSLSDLAAEQGRTRQQLLDAHDEDIAAMQERAAKLNVPLNQYAGELFGPSQPGAVPVEVQE